MFFSHDKKVSPFPVNFKNIQLTFVKECHLLGIYLSEDISNRNIEASIQTFYRKCNEVKFDFNLLSSDIKAKLISIYCMDLYGSQLWSYSDSYVERFYTAWRRVTRSVWNLPYRAHCNLLHTINNTMPIDCMIEKRCINFIYSCLHSDNYVIKCIALSSLENSYSIIGKNYRFLSYKYGLAHCNWFNQNLNFFLIFINSSITRFLIYILVIWSEN